VVELRRSSPDDADGVLRVLAARDFADFGSPLRLDGRAGMNPLTESAIFEKPVT
jgi:hypothetical protein